jgi:hypothetical protein
VKIVSFADIDAVRWDEVAESSPQAWLFHRSEWVRIETRFAVGRNHSFGVESNGRVVGIMPLYFSDAVSGTGGERLLHSGFHRHTGLAVPANVPLPEVNAARAAAMSHIFNLAIAEDCDRIQLNAHNLAPENLGEHRSEVPFWVADYGFYLGLNLGPMGMVPAPGLATCNADQIVALDRTEDDLFARLENRRAIRKAQRAGLELRLAASNVEIDEYYRLAELSASRTGEQLAPQAYYATIAAAFAPSGRCAILFAVLQSKPIAAVFLLQDKAGVSFLAGVSDPNYLETRCNDFTHWEAILWAKRKQYRSYRLGPIFPEVPADWAIAKVSRFKAKFGGKAYTTIQGSYFRRPERYFDAARAHLELLCMARTGSLVGTPA